jgi:hypothetical protein
MGVSFVTRERLKSVLFIIAWIEIHACKRDKPAGRVAWDGEVAMGGLYVLTWESHV